VLARAQERLPDNLILRRRLPTTCEPLTVDADRLEQILDTLLDNAIRYSPGGGEVELAYEHDAGRARFSVRDTGIGIAAGHQPHIGERFYRADPEQVGGARGVGLGLSISRQLLELIGGRLWFESAEGVGSTFYVELPA
jgi:two-component system sensor histidine kinase VicK